MSTRKHGIVVYGATGYTGRLVCEYLNERYGGAGEVSWAMAGRSAAKLAQVADELDVSAEVPRIVADSSDPSSISDMVREASLVLTTVGPYQLYGSDVVKACVEAGTDYVDLCGEPAWMHQMITAHEAAAKASGARVVFSTGFDSIPFDCGVYFLQQHALRTTGAPLSRVKGRVRHMKGTFSGGTMASFRATMAAAKNDRDLVKVLLNPFSLCGGFRGPEQPKGNKPIYEEDLGSWSAPFVMASINTKNIHRTNHLLGHPYGADFVYDEMLLTGPGEAGEQMAQRVASDDSMATSTLKPGEGPSKEEREAGSYDVLFVGEASSTAGGPGDGTVLKARVRGDRDPGYGSTSKMIAESAICLLKDPELAEGGIWTPAAALGMPLIERLSANAGLSFTVEA